jgi:hypothetical protein
MRYDDEKYTKAVDTIAEQLVAMILEDGKIGYDKEDYLCAAADYKLAMTKKIISALLLIML